MENIGNIQIIHIDAHQTWHYLNATGHFTTNVSASAAYYALKSDNTTIYHGDAITIHTGSHTLAYQGEDVLLVPREDAHRYHTKFIVNQLEPSTGAIDYDQPLLLVTSVSDRVGLQALWRMDTGIQPELRLVNRSFSHLENVQSTLFMFAHMGHAIPYQKFTQPKAKFIDKHRGYILLLLIIAILILITLSNK